MEECETFYLVQFNHSDSTSTHCIVSATSGIDAIQRLTEKIQKDPEFVDDITVRPVLSPFTFID